MTGRIATFVMQTVTNENGEYIPLLAVEGEKGYHKTDWVWGKDFQLATQCANERNERAGLTRKEAAIIQLGTMSS